MIAYSKEELLILGGFSTGETKVDNKYERSIYKLKCSSGTVYRLDDNNLAWRRGSVGLVTQGSVVQLEKVV